MKPAAPSQLEHWIVVVGRSNFAKSSRSLEQMVQDLRSQGFYVHSFESQKSQRAQRVNSWFNALLSGHVAAFCSQQGWQGKCLQKIVKGFWRLAHPSTWDVARLRGLTNNERAAQDLRKLLRDWQQRWPTRCVHVFAHSAGGIVASWVAAEPNVCGLVCFGYPFRHPHMPPEPYRTVHLHDTPKPFLIIQGDRDEYGSAQYASQFALSDTIRVRGIPSDHDYDHLPSDLYQSCLEWVAHHFKGKLAPA